MRGVAFSPDDRLLASGGQDQLIKVWNVDPHDLRGTLTGHTDMVSAVAFAQRTLVSTSWDHTIRTWDADALEPRATLTAGTEAVIALAVAPDGRHLLTGGAEHSLVLWKSTEPE
jgi:WD40 repeat protein